MAFVDPYVAVVEGHELNYIKASDIQNTRIWWNGATAHPREYTLHLTMHGGATVEVQMESVEVIIRFLRSCGLQVPDPPPEWKPKGES